MKYLFAIIFLFAALSLKAQTTVIIQWQPIKATNGSVGDTIYYDPARKLTWDDFRGRPVAASPAAAITESGFGYRMSMQSYKQRATIVITVFCYFNKRGSWVKRDMDNDYALLHEQHHYDITFINANLFVQKLKEAKFTIKNYDALVEQIHDECFAALDKMQNEYDGETSNGRVPRIQYKWNRKIDEQLVDLLPTSSR